MISEGTSRTASDMHELLLSRTTHGRLRPLLTVLGLGLLVAVLAAPGSTFVLGYAGSAAVPSAPVAVHPLGAGTAPLGSASSAVLPSAEIASLVARGLSAHPLAAPGPGTSYLSQLRAASPATAAGPLLSSTASNFLVTGSDCSSWGILKGTTFPQSFGGASIAQAGPANSTLVVGGGSILSLFNNSGSPCSTTGTSYPWLSGRGSAAAWESTDGGQTWQMNFPNLASNWTTAGSFTNNSLTWGASSVASASDNMTYDAFMFVSQCFWVGLNCPASSTADFPPWGIAVAPSTDGGAVWGTTTQLRAVTPAAYRTFPSNCTTFTNGLYYNDIPEKPWVTTNGTYAVVGWDVLHIDINSSACQFLGYQATVQISYTTNSGTTWSAPVNLTGTLGQFASLGESPAATHTVYAAFMDYQNYSSTTGQISIGFTKSTNGGSTWSSPRDAVSIGVDPIYSTSPDAFPAITNPALTVDNWSSSPYSGTIYIAWSDNQTGTSKGYPAIDLVRSTNGGTTWTSPTIISTPGTNPIYIDPTVAVGPDGTVWVTYYGIGLATGNYNVYGVYSTNGGATWSRQFVVTDAASQPGSGITDIGLTMGSTASAGRVTPAWTDCRSSSCYSGGDTALYVAHVSPVNISSTSLNAPTASVTTFGQTSSYTLPVDLGWDTGSTQTVQVPPSLPYNSTYIDEFTGWSGATTSTSYRATFTYSGGPSLVANYAPSPAAFLSGYITPDPTGLQLLVDGTPQTPSPYNTTSAFYYIPVASGASYYVNVSAPGYQSQWVLEPTTARQTAWHNFTLLRVTGTVSGTVSPSNATVTVNGTRVTLATLSGVTSYSVAVPWGDYWVNATAPGFTSFSQYVLLPAGVVTTVNILLSGGWIYGVVKSPIPATNVKVRLSGVQVNLTSAGTFNVSRPGGTYSLTATEAGYNLVVLSSIVVTPGATTLVNVSLTNRGWINGTVGPTTALKGLEILMTNGSTGGAQSFNPTTGAFSVPLLGGKVWTVKVTSPGYNASVSPVPVSAGNVSWLNVTLLKAPCTGSSCGTNQNNTTNTTKTGPTGGGGGIGLTTILLLVAVIALAAVLGVVLLTRRRASPPPPTAPEEPDQTYQGTAPSELPHLQSDGTMGPPPGGA